jgi:hypothetical protein
MSRTTKPRYTESIAITRHRMATCKALIESSKDPEIVQKAKDQLCLLEMSIYTGAPQPKIITAEEDRQRRASRFEEDNIVNAWAKWFKQKYPNLPFTVDKVAQHRSKFGGMVHKSAAYMRGNPDIFIQSPIAGFSGCYIEQKKSDDIFYAGTKILRPGADNQHVWQSLYHADLREQGYWCMFSISLEATKKITQRYMAGNPYPQQVFEYYCKPEDYHIFADRKHFKPVGKPGK